MSDIQSLASLKEVFWGILPKRELNVHMPTLGLYAKMCGYPARFPAPGKAH